MTTPKTDEELAYERLRKALINGDLPVGQFLSQRKLAEIAGVSVVTVRSALRILERDGIVENVPRWGVRIPIETEAKLRDRYFMREMLEVTAVRRLVQRYTASEAQTLRTLAERCDVANFGDLPTFAEAHFDLHHAIALGGGSPLLVETLDRICYRSTMLFDAHARMVRMVNKDAFSVRHVPLVEALLSGDPELAERSMLAHIELGLQFELEAIRKQPEAEAQLDGQALAL